MCFLENRHLGYHQNSDLKQKNLHYKEGLPISKRKILKIIRFVLFIGGVARCKKKEVPVYGTVQILRLTTNP